LPNWRPIAEAVDAELGNGKVRIRPEAFRPEVLAALG
jgi:hypothetical protein